MTSCSTEEQCLEDITKGDTLKFDLEFYNTDATEKDISGKAMIFSMISTDDKKHHAVKYKIIFPENEKSSHGKAHVKIPPVETIKLVADTEYKFYFKYIESLEDIETLGSGLVQVVS